jgi:hypothetical protein
MASPSSGRHRAITSRGTQVAFVLIDFKDDTQAEIVGVTGPFRSEEEADRWDEDHGQRWGKHIVFKLTSPDECRCGGTGVLWGSIDVHDGADSFDADHVVRCDSCAIVANDLDAAKFLAACQSGWVVHATDFDENLCATENSYIYVRTSPADAACAQLAILNDLQDDPEIPSVLVHVEFIEQDLGEITAPLRAMINKIQ